MKSIHLVAGTGWEVFIRWLVWNESIHLWQDGIRRIHLLVRMGEKDSSGGKDGMRVFICGKDGMTSIHLVSRMG